MNPEEMLVILKALQDELEGAETIHPEHRRFNAEIQSSEVGVHQIT